MSAYFNIELDTTSPTLQVEVTKLQLAGYSVELEITSSEPLSEDQNIYIADSAGIRHQVILQRISSQILSGFVDTDEFEEGMATVHVQLWDEVYNSVIYEEPIMIVNDGLSFCMHNIIEYTEPIFRCLEDSSSVTVKYNKATTDILYSRPVANILKDNPLLIILYKAPSCTVRRCHDI